jgi:nucleotide-binding universal stress UspA family protein
MKTVLAPVDFSTVTNRVIADAIKLARPLKGRIILLHVVPPPLAIRNVLPAVEDVKLRAQAASKEADQKLADLKRAFQRRFPSIGLVHVIGAPVASIIEQARALEAAYIVIGSHGHTAAYDMVMGSVASGVIKDAPCPVLVIPPISAQGAVSTRSGPTAVTA